MERRKLRALDTGASDLGPDTNGAASAVTPEEAGVTPGGSFRYSVSCLTTRSELRELAIVARGEPACAVDANAAGLQRKLLGLLNVARRRLSTAPVG